MTTLLTMKGFNKKADYLCFTANTANSTVRLGRAGTPTSIVLETSTDGNIWSDYTIATRITLSNVWDKVYFRNKSETPTWFSIGDNNYYIFQMTWSIAASWDVNYLLCKNSTDTLIWDNCFYQLFQSCSSLISCPKLTATTLTQSCYNSMFYECTNLITAPELPATTLTTNCYNYMFYDCTNLETLPKLPATTLTNTCYQYMFNGCSKIKLSTTQTWEYQNEYRIPETWTWTTATNALYRMFRATWWTFTWTPSINTTYYTSNTVV